MELEHIFRSIRFRMLQPMMRLPRPIALLLEQRIPLLQSAFDSLNTILPVPRDSVRRLAGVPRMSTIAIGAILSECVRRMPEGSCYLNIGVWHGYTLFAGMVGNPERHCIGVDNFSQFGGPRASFLRRFASLRSPLHEFHDADWREYMRTHRTPVGVFFYDASHDCESQYEALKAAHPHLISGAIVIVDDWNWGGPREGTERFRSEFPGYEVIFEQRTSCNAHPTFWNGIVVLRKCS